MIAYMEADNATELRVTFHTLQVTFQQIHSVRRASYKVFNVSFVL